MKTKDRDPQSYFTIITSFLKKADLAQEEYEILTKELTRYLTLKLGKEAYVHPTITKFCTDWYREFYRLINNRDPYLALKEKSNREARKILTTIGETTFQDALRISIKGNELDFGSIGVLNPNLDTFAEEFKDISSLTLTIDDSKQLEGAIGMARSVLFLCDNAGEILFDIPLLKHLRGSIPKDKIFIAAKSSPMLNDVTVKELEELGMDEYGTIISIGSNCFGLHEEDVSKEFKSILHDADLVIAKGQAYLEFFTEYNFEKVFNITRVKYPIINSALGTLSSHQNVIISSRRYAYTGEPYSFDELHPKIIDRSKIRALAERIHKEGKKIVTVNGSYDVLHYGHIRTLQEAKRQGDVLILGLNSDSSIKQYKAPWRPINSQDHRAEFLAALESIDYVCIFDETTPISFLEDIKPHVHCNGVEYGEDCIEAPTVKKYGGKIYLTGRYFSTTEMIEKLVDAHKKDLAKKEVVKGLKVSRKEIFQTIERQKGILFSTPAIVHRSTYSGRDIIAQNSQFEEGYVDSRGYVPVELWIMSLTQAENEIMKDGEGITQLKIGSELVKLSDAALIAEQDLFGSYKDTWPLTKILDIGGQKVTTSFSDEKEVPPIPTHVHSGIVENGKLIGPGKLEAYFFPPVGLAPYNQNFGRVITRLGLKPQTTQEQLQEALKGFGMNDVTYELCNVFEINAYDGWTIPAGVVHAPGPWITFEIQRPQDDFNLLGWQLGQRIPEAEIESRRREVQLRGLQDESDFVRQAVDWEASVSPNFKSNHYRPSKVIERGEWGRRMQIFFDEFYGEAIEIKPGHKFTRNADERPFAGLVWSGQGLINENSLDVSKDDQKEFLVVPNTPVTIENIGKETLYIYTVFPIKESSKDSVS